MLNQQISVAMPIVSRRTLITAGSLAALVHSVALATENATELSEKIDLHDAAKSRCRELWQFVDDALDAEDCPNAGFLVSRELGPYHYEVTGPTRLASPDEIDVYIDKKIHCARKHIEWGITPAAHERSIVRFEDDRARAKEILLQRGAAYDAYKERSGITAADSEADALSDVVDNLRTAIIGWDCRSLEDADMKARFIVENWFWIGSDDIKAAVGSLVHGNVAA